MIHLRYIILTTDTKLYVFCDTCTVERLYSDIGGGKMCNNQRVWNHGQLDFKMCTQCEAMSKSFMLAHDENITNLKTNTLCLLVVILTSHNSQVHNSDHQIVTIDMFVY
jgi:hypothetical protein